MVSWQNNSFYRGLKVQERETGLSLADRNRLQNPNGVHSTGGMIATGLLSLLLSGTGANIFTSCAEYFSSDKSNKINSANTTNVETIKTKIDNIFSKYNKELNINSIDDLESLLQEEYNICNNNIANCENNIKNAEEIISKNNELDSKIENLNTRIVQIEEMLKLDTTSDDVKPLLNDYIIKSKTELAKYKIEKQKNKTNSELTIKINDNKELIQYYNKTLDDIKTTYEKDIKDLKTYAKQLRKVNEESYIEDLTDDKASEIVSLIVKYKNATGQKKDEIKTKLEKAIESYTGNNKTILKYKEQLGIKEKK